MEINVISLLVDIPEPLHQRLREYLDRVPSEDYRIVFSRALADYLALKHSVEVEKCPA